MTIVYPRPFPDVPFNAMRCRFDREPLGAFSRAANGRIAFQEFVGGGPWIASYETKPLNETNYGRWHAWKLSMRGNLTFKGYDPRRCYPIAYGATLFNLTRAVGGAFDGTVTVTAAGGGTISLSGFPNGFTITEGDYLSFPWIGGQHLVKFLETVNATAGGLITGIAIDPWLRSGGMAPVSGTLVSPWCEMKIIPGSWNGERTILDPVSFQAIQHMGGDLWYPTEVGSLWAWYDAADASTRTITGSGISEWADKSGNTRHATQSTDADRPTVTAAVQNGLDALLFDGTTDWLAMPSMAAITTAGSGLWVAKAIADPYANGAVIETGNSAETSHHGWNTGDLLDGFGTSTGRRNCGNPIPSLADWWIYSVRSAANDWHCYVNGTSQFSTATNAVGFTATPFIGKTIASNNFFASHIAEILLFSTSLSDEDRQKAEGYLAHKWGITSTLPSDHPYKDTLPKA